MKSQPVLGLIADLCNELDSGRITYCHWKSNAHLDRSASGENDLDLLISRSCVQRFTEILFRLGFKQAFAPPDGQMPGVLDYYGYDWESRKFVHVHAHYQLILGHDATKNYRIPIEKHYLESTVQDGLFKIPSREFELIVLVIRMLIKHSTWDVVLLRTGGISDTAREEIAFLRERISEARITSILKTVLPGIDKSLFDDCLLALDPGCSLLFRIKTGEKIRRRLEAHGRRPAASDIVLKMWRRLAGGVQRRIFRCSPKKRMASGGLMIAIVGGDGSGKTTALKGLYEWLSEEFEILTVHMGKPVWSWTTMTVRGILKIGNLLGLYPFVKEGAETTLYTNSPHFPGHPWVIREVCEARDRYLTYRLARRFATNGGLVLCDRFPLAQIKVMDGPQVERITSTIKTNGAIQSLAKLEKRYYDQIMLPDLLIVLRADPEISVQRKTDETAESVRARAGEIWNQDWQATPARVIDASKSKSEVLSELQALVWSLL